MAKGVKDLYINPVHGEQQVVIDLSDDGFYYVFFHVTPGTGIVSVETHPSVARAQMDADQLNKLISQLIMLREAALG